MAAHWISWIMAVGFMFALFVWLDYLKKIKP